MTSRKSIQDPGKKMRAMKAGVLVLGAIIFVFGSAVTSCNSTNETPAEDRAADQAPPGALPDSVADPEAAEIEAIDASAEYPGKGNYSRFTHANPSHSRLPCLLCHKREDNSAQVSFPGKGGHTPCIGCHVQEFEDRGNAMCTICHTNAEAGEMKRFPTLKTFSSNFNHAKHVRHTNCATCHRPARNGVALSEPAGLAAHATCFQCHTNTSPLGMCSTCHTTGTPVRNSDSARAYSLNFSHREHTRGMSCTTCHTVQAGSARGRQVTRPVPAMHKAPSGTLSCAACHNDKRAFGTADFANCKRCHEGSNFGFR